LLVLARDGGIAQKYYTVFTGAPAALAQTIDGEAAEKLWIKIGGFLGHHAS
jgi:hypothetical protein